MWDFWPIWWGPTFQGTIYIYIFNLISYHSIASYDRFVHGRLPYDNLKPDPILRSLLLSLPYRKLVSTWKEKAEKRSSSNSSLLNFHFSLTNPCLFFVWKIRSLPMQTKITLPKYLTNLDWKTVLKALYALKPSIPHKKALFQMTKSIQAMKSLT